MTNAVNTSAAATLLDLADIQGGILRTYGDGFPKGRNFYLTVRDARAVTASSSAGRVSACSLVMAGSES